MTLLSVCHMHFVFMLYLVDDVDFVITRRNLSRDMEMIIFL